MADTASCINLGGVATRQYGWQETLSDQICTRAPYPQFNANFSGYNRKNENVALKVIKADTDTQEHRILQYLQNSSVAHANITHPGRKIIIQLRDDFALGTTHKCLVSDVMGMSIVSRAEQQYGRRLQAETARAVTYQIALGLDYLWKCGTAHGGEQYLHK